MRTWNVLSVALALSLPAFGADERGNGGDAVVCNHSYSELNDGTAMLLDYYEGKIKWGTPQNLNSATSVDDKVNLMIDRIARLDPQRGKIYRNFFATFYDEAHFEDRLKLPDLPDDGVVRVPGYDCSVDQVAYQQNPDNLPGEKRYYIKREIWDLLDNDSKAGLILHELMYREASNLSENPHKNSRKIRYYNANVASRDFDKMTFYHYRTMLKEIVRLPLRITVAGIPLKADTIKVNELNEVLLGQVETKFDRNGVLFPVKYQELGVWFNSYIHFSKGLVSEMEGLVHFPSSKVGFGLTEVKLGEECLLHSEMPMFVQRVSLYEDGHLKEIEIKHAPWGRPSLPEVPGCYAPGGELFQDDNKSLYTFNPPN